jgi:hypothetical protein
LTALVFRRGPCDTQGVTADAIRNRPELSLADTIESLEGRMLDDLTEMIRVLNAVNRTSLDLLVQQQKRAEAVIDRARHAIAEAQQAAARAETAWRFDRALPHRAVE